MVVEVENHKENETILVVCKEIMKSVSFSTAGVVMLTWCPPQSQYKKKKSFV